MYLTHKITKRIIKRKLITGLFITASVAAFATLGDGGKRKKTTSSVSILMPYTASNFSLRSNYNYKSNNFLHSAEKKNFIILNKTVTYQKGNAAFIVPLNKLPLMGKIKFTSTPTSF